MFAPISGKQCHFKTVHIRNIKNRKTTNSCRCEFVYSWAWVAPNESDSCSRKHHKGKTNNGQCK